MKKYLILFLIIFSGCVDNELKDKAQQKANLLMDNLHTEEAGKYFPEKHFPREEVKRISFEMNGYCDYSNRVGGFIDYNYESAAGTDKVIFFYEYFLKCDSLRFILKYDLQPDPELIWFGTEDLEIENPLIINRSNKLLGN